MWIWSNAPNKKKILIYKKYGNKAFGDFGFMALMQTKVRLNPLQLCLFF